MASYKRPRRQRYSLCYKEELYLATLNYQPTASDIFVATYPKCGTSWMLQIVTLILQKGKHPDTFKDYFSSRPILEIVGPQVIRDMPDPHCLETHLPFELVPFSSAAKYIYVARHPKDCLVSFYHHMKFFPAHYFTQGTFADFFQAFINGDVDFGDYFDNLLSWYNHRYEPNILFISYEEMKADHRGTVIKVARFLGEQYVQDLEEDKNLLEEIVRKSTFHYMRDVFNEMYNQFIERPRDISNDPDMPDGIRLLAKITAEAFDAGQKSIGQFLGSSDSGTSKKIQLNSEQEKQLWQWISKKTKDSDVMSLWEERRPQVTSKDSVHRRPRMKTM